MIELSEDFKKAHQALGKAQILAMRELAQCVYKAFNLTKFKYIKHVSCGGDRIQFEGNELSISVYGMFLSGEEDCESIELDGDVGFQLSTDFGLRSLLESELEEVIRDHGKHYDDFEEENQDVAMSDED